MRASIQDSHFLLRRFHSALGLIPLGAFLVFHLWENSQSRFGSEHYNAQVASIQQLNYLLIIELVVIALPLLLHAGYGLVIIGSGSAEPLRYRYARNWLYWLQRMSGIAIVAFLALHLGLTRFASLFDPQIDADLFSYMQQSLAQPVTFALYLLGLWLSVFHLANGLATAAISWGLTTSATAQRRFGWFCLGFGLLLGALGTHGLIGFLK
ncbi:succinate dehydrogenase [Thiorhodovibrio frisius]|uniref:Succinate dehydrogenase/fumarate reductase, cytochrome b subunit n=1 Tax=Thiorhodovibrio frisius TaxID=631362 RepID=H8Z8L8_9GAMM|nr:succinate dehydrogenase [Thiorhodovibrio frisius]EIC19423.1 succinate dehydrogenase/fumarate reductase, cytochrome b subunit [Thiorhodovibrio frisius]WPL22275.1 Succinate dehydrogenase cytochrome b558 subunit [Thiorhodovibrio frisius]